MFIRQIIDTQGQGNLIFSFGDLSLGVFIGSAGIKKIYTDLSSERANKSR